MMKIVCQILKIFKLLPIFIWITVIVTVLQAKQEKFVIRIQNPTEGMFMKYRSPEYDMSAYKSGEYLDLVVGRDLYGELTAEGFDISISQTESELLENLRGQRDLYGYRNYEETLNELQGIVAQYPNICQLVDLGDTWGKEYSDNGTQYYDNYYHESWGLKLSDNVELEEDEPSTFFMGLHHSREPISVEVVMGILHHLLDNYETDPEITNIIDNTQIWFVPIVNPNGHKIVTEEVDLWWRKNIRDNNQNYQFDTSNDYGYGTDGVDPNRNYGFQYGEVGTSNSFSSPVYHGPNAWSEPEIVSMKHLLESHHFVTGITYHSYSELVLFPFGYELGVVAPDHYALEELAIEMAVTIPSQNGGHYTPQQSLELYPCMGTTDDYAYGVHSIFSFTVELGTQFIPPAGQIDDIVEDNLDAALILLNRVNRQTVTGLITDSETGNPVVAEIYVDGIDNTGNSKLPSLSNSNFGRYYRLLQAGNYDVTFSSDGYESVTETVSINQFQQTELNISMNPVTMIQITGRVIDGLTNVPLSEAEVSVGEDISYTDLNGNFSFPPSYEGSYTIQSELENYSTIEILFDLTVEDSFIELEMFPFTTESFESSIFTDEWSDGGNADWYFTSQSVYDGNYSVRSGEIEDNENSDLSLALVVTEYGSIGFHYRVASEYSPSGNYFYDGLEFYINNDLMGQFQPTPEGDTPWTYSSFPVSPGDYLFTWRYAKDGGGGSTDMEEDCAWIDLIEFPPIQENDGQMITINPEYSLDWNLVSLPILTDESNPEVLFPNWVENTVFSFNGEYVGEEELESGIGYWIRLSNEDPISFTGYENNEMQLSIMEGWNLLGSISHPIISDEGIIDPNEILLLPTLYEFTSGSYQQSSMMLPGFGYWIRSISDGEIYLTTMPSTVSRSVPDITKNLELANSIQINGKILYFGVKIPEHQHSWYSLPPLFSEVKKDVRFTKKESYVSENGGEISIRNMDNSQIISYNISSDQVWELTNSNNVDRFTLVESGELQLNKNVTTIYLKEIEKILNQFSISPAFPNPFNNQTHFSLTQHKNSMVSMNIYNLKGELVKSLLNQNVAKGQYSIHWDGFDDRFSPVSTGTYLLHVVSGDFQQFSKLILLK